MDPIDLKLIMLEAGEEEINIAKFMLKLNPKERPTAEDIRNSPYLSQNILTPEELAKYMTIRRELAVDLYSEIDEASKKKRNQKPISSVEEFLAWEP